MTAAIILFAVVFTAGYIAIAVARWLEHTTAERERADLFWLNVQAADFGEPSRAQVESNYDLPITDDGCDDWERPVIGLRDRMADIRAQIAANHEREVERLRSELECDAAVVLWLDGGAA